MKARRAAAAMCRCLKKLLLALVASLLAATGATAQPAEHDPSVLAKLRDGRLDQVSLTPPGRTDLAAVVKALGDAGCRFDATSKVPFTELLERLLQGLDRGSLALLGGHPTYVRTGVMLADGGCGSSDATAVARNLVRLLEMPPRAPQDELRRQQVDAWNAFYLETYTLSPAQQAALARELEGQKIIACYYRHDDPATPLVSEVRRLAWYGRVPARAAAWSRSSHPLAVVALRATDACPTSLRAFMGGSWGTSEVVSVEPMPAPDPPRAQEDRERRKREVQCHLAREHVQAAQRDLERQTQRSRPPSSRTLDRLREQEERVRAFCTD